MSFPFPSNSRNLEIFTTNLFAAAFCFSLQSEYEIWEFPRARTSIFGHRTSRRKTANKNNAFQEFSNHRCVILVDRFFGTRQLWQSRTDDIGATRSDEWKPKLDGDSYRDALSCTTSSLCLFDGLRNRRMKSNQLWPRWKTFEIIKTISSCADRRGKKTWTQCF